MTLDSYQDLYGPPEVERESLLISDNQKYNENGRLERAIALT